MSQKTSWFFALFLGLLLTLTYFQLDPDPSPLRQHLSTRYIQDSQRETGMGSPSLALLADYRAFDLWAAALLFSAAALGALAAVRFPGWRDLFPAFLWAAGACLALALGALTLLQGSNFLDYEALVPWTGPLKARPQGALFLIGTALLTLGGLVLAALREFLDREAADGA